MTVRQLIINALRLAMVTTTDNATRPLYRALADQLRLEQNQTFEGGDGI
ncbi:hypothetical protein U8335_03895 [Roseiconus lacunae]|uniref:Uncharacterized protein n=1 Tax=Roseiconus lacunae TaxID=2605694 RepID=A0ABT7PHK6_9BACT|nr:hypothetical protein [Roseiconus lacunae]MDM4015984.1 hypothetical protein [Roseiconus lacunae]WRQ51684.1 hypothetical protein U8335_03895 [Stieleria sp. HD01]